VIKTAKFSSLSNTPYRYKIMYSVACLCMGSAMIYPSDINGVYAVCHAAEKTFIVQKTEKYLRHTNSVLPIATVIVLRDWKGAGQIIGVIGAGIVASHGPKRLLNDVSIMGTRLGQRPSSKTSKHNMPSGHSTLASAGGWFMARRYSMWFLLLCLPITALTMYARVMLGAHTVSATIAGTILGVLVAALFVRRRRPIVRQ
jgi:membrane-associated phospholipid phosphatase